MTRILLILSSLSFAAEIMDDRRVPDEYESLGGHSLGFAGGGMAALNGQAAVRMNPAMVGITKTYEVGAGYNWPSFGRDYFQASIIDSKSSNIGAGVAYTGFLEEFQPTKDEPKFIPVKSRMQLSLSKVMGRVSLGFGVQYVEAFSKDDTGLTQSDYMVTKGTSLSAGIAGLMTRQLRYAIVARNISNKKIADYAPKTYQMGLAYLLAKGDVSLNIDYRQRDRVSDEKIDIVSGMGLTANELNSLNAENERYSSPEKMAILSASARVYDALRLFAGYGLEVSAVKRRVLSGGLAVVSKTSSFSFSASKPYDDAEETHQAINISIMTAL